MADRFFSRLVDPRERNLGIKIMRISVPLHPYFHFLYQYRLGNIRRSLQVAKNYRPKTALQQKILDRAQEMASILDNGWDILSPEPVQSGNCTGRVLFALHNSLPWDGAGYAVRSQQILKHFVYMGLEVSAVTRPGYPWDLEQHRGKPYYLQDCLEGVTYERLQGQGLSLGALDRPYVQGYAELLANMATLRQTLIIHGHSNYLNGLAATLAAKRIKGLGVYEMRGLWHKSRAVMEPGFEKTDLYQYLEHMELAAAGQAHKVVAISQALKDYLQSQGISEDKIQVVPNAVDTQLFKPVDPDAELTNQLQVENRTVVGFIGSLTGYEGVDLIIKAVSRLINAGLPLSLIIVGAGYAEKDLKKLASGAEAGRHIHFTGKVPFEQVNRYYSLVDIFPFPRKDLPVCRLVPPLKILESMAMDKAVIASNLPPLTEIVTHEQTGLICEPDDEHSLAQAIEELASSDELRSKLGQRAGQWARENRSWKHIARKYLDVYNVADKANQ